MLDDESLMSSIEQTIDALTFAQTHVIDTDFRAHSKSTLDSVLSLQEDQRNRVEHAFRGIRPSPTFLAQTLLSSYRGEAASVTLAKEAAAGGGGGADPSGSINNVATAIDLMSDNKCRAFKKEMKQRIHEWEGAFREHHGRDAAPQDKATLRPVYELYKHAKARVVQSGDGAATPQPMMLSGTPAAAASHHPSPLASYGATPMSEDRYGSAAGGGLRPSSTPTTTGAAGYRSGGGGGTAVGMDPPTRSAPSPSSSLLSAPASSSSQQQQQQQYTSTSQGSALGTPRTTMTPRGSSGPVEPPPSPNRHSAGGSGSSSGGAPPPPQPLPPATAAVVGVNIEELLNEKRRIKRTLHQFESAFESQHGRRPTRDDRKDYNTEYHRYGELKALLNELGRGND